MSTRKFGYEEFGVGFVIGLAVGATVAILAAPQSGSVTREKIGDLIDTAKDQINDIYEKSKSTYDTVLDRLEGMLGSNEQSFKKKLEELKDEISKFHIN